MILALRWGGFYRTRCIAHAYPHVPNSNPLPGSYGAPIWFPQGDELPPGPVATVSVPGLAQPLVGFWGVFFDIICGGPSAPVSGEGGGGAGAGGGRNCSSSSWNTGLPSELVWKALLHAFRVSSLRRGWDENAFGIGTTVAGSRGGSPVGGCAPEDPGAAGSAAATAAAAAHRRRRKDTSRSLWECVRLLLAASPFSVEFGGRGQAFAVTVTAQATSTAATSKGRRYAANGAAGSSSFEPVTAVAESFSAPGMVARMLLERVLVLARFRAPEAGVHGVVEKLWEGVQRISATLSIMDSERSEDRGAGTSDRTAEGRNSLRVRSARKSRAASAGEDDHPAFAMMEDVAILLLRKPFPKERTAVDYSRRLLRARIRDPDVPRFWPVLRTSCTRRSRS